MHKKLLLAICFVVYPLICGATTYNPPGAGGSGTGDVTVFGTPTDGQISVWVDADTIEGDSSPEFDGGDITGLEDNVTIQGQYAIVRNTTGSTISAGKFVYFTGASGQKNLIGLASNATYDPSHATGFVVSDINNNSNGYVLTDGTAYNVDTATWGFGDGSEIYAGVDGDPVDSKPTDAITVPLGRITYSNPGAGILFVDIRYPIIGVAETYTDSDYNGDIGAVTKNDLRDYAIQFDTDGDGDLSDEAALTAAFQAINDYLTDISGLTPTANNLIGWDSTGEGIENKSDITISLTGFSENDALAAGSDGSMYPVNVPQNYVFGNSGGSVDAIKVNADTMDLTDDYAFTGALSGPPLVNAIGDGSTIPAAHMNGIINLNGGATVYLPEASTVKPTNGWGMVVFRNTDGGEYDIMPDSGDHWQLKSGASIGDGSGLEPANTTNAITTVMVTSDSEFLVFTEDGTSAETD